MKLGWSMKKLRVLDLFSGIGGMALGLERTGGFKTVAFCEIDSYASRVLSKWWPHVPNFSHGIVGLNALLKRVRTSSRRAFPARTFHSLARVPDLPEPVRDSSGRCYEPFAWFDHEGHCWRTWQRCLVEGWTLFSGTWPRSGMTRNGIAFRRAPLVPLTDATASGYCLPTPTATSYGSNQGGAAGRVGPVRHSLESMARHGMLPTPRPCSGLRSSGANRTEILRALEEWPEQIGGALNPQFVEWLMGFPKDYTLIGPEASGLASRASKRASRAGSTGSDASATQSCLKSHTASAARSSKRKA